MHLYPATICQRCSSMGDRGLSPLLVSKQISALVSIVQASIFRHLNWREEGGGGVSVGRLGGGREGRGLAETQRVERMARPTTLPDGSEPVTPADPAFLREAVLMLRNTLFRCGNAASISKSSIFCLDAWTQIYWTTDPLVSATVTCLLIAVILFLVAEKTGNHSQVDRIWSILPVVASWHFAIHSEFDARLLLMAALTTAWGIGLTYQFAMKGGYRWPWWHAEEDYRWPQYIKKIRFLTVSPVIWMPFSFLVIHVYQVLHLLAQVTPAYVAYICATGRTAAFYKSDSLPDETTTKSILCHKKLNGTDAIAAGIFLVMLAIRTIADEQQRLFQNEKKALTEGGKRPMGRHQRGFLWKGFFSFSRHPAYAAEQMMWLCFYGFSLATYVDPAWCFCIPYQEPLNLYLTSETFLDFGKGLLDMMWRDVRWVSNWSVAGIASLIAIFQISTRITEYLSSQKYPKYAEYQQVVPMFFPGTNGILALLGGIVGVIFKYAGITLLFNAIILPVWKKIEKILGLSVPHYNLRPKAGISMSSAAQTSDSRGQHQKQS